MMKIEELTNFFQIYHIWGFEVIQQAANFTDFSFKFRSFAFQICFTSTIASNML